MKVTLADAAVRDLEEIVAHYERQGVPNVGANLVREILDRIETLKGHLDIGRIVPRWLFTVASEAALRLGANVVPRILPGFSKQRIRPSPRLRVLSCR